MRPRGVCSQQVVEFICILALDYLLGGIRPLICCHLDTGRIILARTLRTKAQFDRNFLLRGSTFLSIVKNT